MGRQGCVSACACASAVCMRQQSVHASAGVSTSAGGCARVTRLCASYKIRVALNTIMRGHEAWPQPRNQSFNQSINLLRSEACQQTGDPPLLDIEAAAHLAGRLLLLVKVETRVGM